MGFSLIDKNLNEDSYDEYVDKIVNIFRLSNKESSILFDMEIKDYKAKIKLSIVSQHGEKEEFSDMVFKCDTIFYHKFLTSLVNKINQNSNIVVKDIVDFSDSNLVTFRLITENNDLFTINGLSFDDAKSLLSIIEDDNDDSKLVIPNNNGIGNTAIFLLLIGIIILEFFLYFVFIK